MSRSAGGPPVEPSPDEGDRWRTGRARWSPSSTPQPGRGATAMADGDEWARIVAAVETQEGALLERLRRVTGIDTTVPPGRNYPALVEAVEPEFQALGLRTERVVVPEEQWRAIPLPLAGERVNLVATLPAPGRPPLTVYTHMDVVPVGPGWTHDPWGAELVDGRVYGRGTADMKGTITTMLTALAVMRELG